MKDFKLTYSTMFDPPAELHQRFDRALARVKAGLGREHAMLIAGKDRSSKDKFEVRSPIDRDWLLGVFQQGGADEVDAAVAAARAAYPAWVATPWQERVRLLRRAAQLIEERVYDLGAALALEVGKNRMESLGEVQETADLIEWYCAQMEANQGYDRILPHDPLKGYTSRNRSVLKPYGAWAVIAPFNFPFALAGGPVGAALVTGNTVVFKVASDTAWSGRLLAEVFRDAGLPEGVCNYVSGSGAAAGESLIRHRDVAAVTFTGSYEVGMHIYRSFAQGAWPRPCIAEMGGKNAAIVTRHADLERAATGIVRSAFGLSGQKCSACSRVYVERPVAEALRERMRALTETLSIGDPTDQANWMGPVINASAFARYRKCVDNLASHGQVLAGGRQLVAGDLARAARGRPLEVHVLEHVGDADLRVGLVEVAGLHVGHDRDDGRARVAAHEEAQPVAERGAYHRLRRNHRIEKARVHGRDRRRHRASGRRRRKISPSIQPPAPYASRRQSGAPTNGCAPLRSARVFSKSSSGGRTLATATSQRGGPV